MNWLKKLFSDGSQCSGKDLKSLIRALKADIPSTRCDAADALGGMGDPRAVKDLIKVLKKDEDEEVRFRAAYALGQIGDARG